MSSAWECPACGVRIALAEVDTKLRGRPRITRRWWQRTARLRVTVPDAWLADVYAHTWTCGGAR